MWRHRRRGSSGPEKYRRHRRLDAVRLSIALRPASVPVSSLTSMRAFMDMVDCMSELPGHYEVLMDLATEG